MLFLEANNALTFLNNDIMPFTDSAISLDLTNREVVIVAEADFVHPVLAGLNSDFTYWPSFVKDNLLVALVDARVSCERRCHPVVQMKLH